MKTTKKGFTLIELIVVIAIIGVLAAILVPSMLGYVKKSKIQSANTTASSVYKAVNSAGTEADEEDKFLKSGKLTVNTGNKTIAGGGGGGAAAATGEVTGAELYTMVQKYFGDITKCNGALIQVNTEGQCVAVAVSSGKYAGAYPGGVVTVKTWDSTYKNNTTNRLDAILTAAITKAGS